MFYQRHKGIRENEIPLMLSSMHLNSMEELLAKTLPKGMVPPPNFDFPAKEEQEVFHFWQQHQEENKKSLIGQGSYNTYFPPLLKRLVFENPSWYSAYTPYQAEIAQGRLQALMIFQEMVADLTGLDIANASLLDDGSAAFEAMLMAKRTSENSSNRFLVDSGLFAHIVEVLQERASAQNIELVIDHPQSASGDFFGALLAYPQKTGEIIDFSKTISHLKNQQTRIVFYTDLLFLTLFQTPNAFGADIAIGSVQRFGLPMGFGGPAAAFLACKKEFLRQMPGRIIGFSKDSQNNTALRMCLQTREQHIRRDKAHSNICTSQSLTAILSAFFALYHTPKGLIQIAQNIFQKTAKLKNALENQGFKIVNRRFFDTLTLDCSNNRTELFNKAKDAGFLLFQDPQNENFLSLTVDECTSNQDIQQLFSALTNQNKAPSKAHGEVFFPRENAPLRHAIFSRFESEAQFTRYLHSLENKDFALNRGMIPLGSCTMKLNAASILEPLSWPHLHSIHPLWPNAHFSAILEKVKHYLKIITAMDAITLQPNSGAQGEYTGLLTIKRFLKKTGQQQRIHCFIPQSAHGTNPASAKLAGFSIVPILCDEKGYIDFSDLTQKATQYQNTLACLMLTYPSTHGVFEENIIEICQTIHENGGQVYMDGANLNAQVGLMAPGTLGADITHLNLHKTFALPHGGGGPGIGPVACKSHLAEHLPQHITNYPNGSALLNVATLFYLEMMGANNLKNASMLAILNANYLAHHLKKDFPILYTNQQGYVAHECIVDLRTIKKQTGISEVDIAKRLMDYGFHAPTVSFPVAGTLMIEPTESEPLEELNRFLNAMHGIREEIRQIENGTWNKENNPLKNAPHTLKLCTQDEWHLPYSRQVACFPTEVVEKYWPAVARINDVLGDRQPQCRLTDDF